jgi:hypothetical protein
MDECCLIPFPQHIKMSELDAAAIAGTLKVDGKIVLQSRPLMDENGQPSTAPPGIELVTSKAAVEPVWYLPGVAERFGMYVLRTALRASGTEKPYLAPKVFFAVPCSKTPEECTLNSSPALTSKSSYPPLVT